MNTQVRIQRMRDTLDANRAISRTTERIADEMAEEILKDPIFRARMQALLQRAFDQTLASPGTDRGGTA